MELSEFLSIVEICVTILVGYYLSHWVSVRDSQTRALKDYYIEMLKSIRIEVDNFFNNLLADKLTPQKIASWYGSHQDELTRFDNGLRMALPINKRLLSDVINDIHEQITGSDDYNDKYRKNKYIPSAAERVEIAKLRQQVDASFNDYIVSINNSRQFAWYQIFWQRISSDFEYCWNNKSKGWHVFLPWLFSLLVWLAICVVVAWGMCNAYCLYSGNQQDLKASQEKEQYFQQRCEEILEIGSSLIQKENVLLDKIIEMDTLVVKVEPSGKKRSEKRNNK